MTFSFAKERIVAISSDGIPMGSIAFPRIRPGLVDICQVTTDPRFRNRDVAGHMMEALLAYLTDQNQKAILTSPFAQQYIGKHPHWKHILPGQLHFTTH